MLEHVALEVHSSYINVKFGKLELNMEFLKIVGIRNFF